MTEETTDSLSDLRTQYISKVRELLEIAKRMEPNEILIETLKDTLKDLNELKSLRDTLANTTFSEYPNT